jgi:hypothetical protein
MNTPADYEAALQRWNDRSRKCAVETGASTSSVSPFVTVVTVELFGVARLLAKTPSVSLALPVEGSVADVLAALAEKLPVLVGRVIDCGGASLVNGYACNINGLNFVRSPSAKVNAGDKIFILSADAGG